MVSFSRFLEYIYPVNAYDFSIKNQTHPQIYMASTPRDQVQNAKLVLSSSVIALFKSKMMKCESFKFVGVLSF